MHTFTDQQVETIHTFLEGNAEVVEDAGGDSSLHEELIRESSDGVVSDAWVSSFLRVSCYRTMDNFFADNEY